MKRGFQESVNAPVKDVADALARLLAAGAFEGKWGGEVEQIITKLRGTSTTAPTIARPAIPAKVQGFFEENFPAGRPAPRKVVPAVAPAPKRVSAPPAKQLPQLQSLNLGASLDSFDLSIWDVKEELLVNLANDLLRGSPIRDILGGDAVAVESFLRKASQSFKPNPFHNFRRALDNLQFAAALLARISLDLSKAERAAVLLAALLHDADHPGTNALFQSRTSSQIALTYNDRSVLENHSASVGWKLVQGAFPAGAEAAQAVRRLFLTAVLKTDYSKLPRFLAKAATADARDPEQRALLVALLVLMADLSFAMRPWTVTRYWYRLMRDEQYQQGAMERRLGMPVAPLMDEKQHRPQALLVQTHYRVMVMPVFQAAAHAFPEVEQDLLGVLGRNMDCNEAELAVEGGAAPSPLAGED
jgi:hypothetical protein